MRQARAEGFERNQTPRRVRREVAGGAEGRGTWRAAWAEDVEPDEDGFPPSRKWHCA
jgi:hypothetical protein